MKRFIFFIIAALLVSSALLIAAAGRFELLSRFLVAAPALHIVTLVAAGFALTSFAFGVFTGDYSWVDRLWSTLPVVFAWFYAFRGGWATPVTVLAALITVWGVRLTANFARRGGYSGEEDYRWVILRGKITNKVAWQLFNLFFICGFQIGLFILFTMPLAELANTVALSGSAAGGAVTGFWFIVPLLFGAIVWETAADQQQWVFQNHKACYRSGQDIPDRCRPDAERGFCTSGLFGLSRHPNYFGELLFWCLVWFAAAIQTGTFLSPALTGPLVLIALFCGSTVFTEGITAGKYPAYWEYQKRVSAIVPWPFSRFTEV